jgi:two-component system, OmpR family, sensor histidine kinase ChvG
MRMAAFRMVLTGVATLFVTVSIVVLYVSQYHAQLIDAKRASLRAQGEIIAAAIAANASLETGSIVLDPNRLPEVEGSQGRLQDDAFAALQLPLSVAPILRKLVPTSDTRARVYARDGTLIADTASFGFDLKRHAQAEDPVTGGASAAIRCSWTRFLSWLLREELPVYREIGTANGASYPEVRLALGGSTAPQLLVTDNGAQIVSVAVPIQYRKAVQGVLLLSTLPGRHGFDCV